MVLQLLGQKMVRSLITSRRIEGTQPLRERPKHSAIGVSVRRIERMENMDLNGLWWATRRLITAWDGSTLPKNTNLVNWKYHDDWYHGFSTSRMDRRRKKLSGKTDLRSKEGKWVNGDLNFFADLDRIPRCIKPGQLVYLS